MDVEILSIGPSPRHSALAEATAKVTLHNGAETEELVIAELQVLKQTATDILFVAFPASRKSDGKWTKIVTTSTRLRHRIEAAVLDAYDRWCNAQPSNCADANSGSSVAGDAR
jgi:DNA-binding cell septation regulator SpoVG